MNAKVQSIYNKIQDQIQDDSLSRIEYISLVGELLGHLECLQDCINEELKTEENYQST